MPNGDEPTHQEIWREINYLKERVTVLATKLDSNLITQKEHAQVLIQLEHVNTRLGAFDPEIIQGRLLTAMNESVATKSDLEWMKSFLWKAIGLAGAILTTVIIALVTHIIIQ